MLSAVYKSQLRVSNNLFAVSYAPGAANASFGIKQNIRAKLNAFIFMDFFLIET
jgi:hypothetical protein